MNNYNISQSETYTSFSLNNTPVNEYIYDDDHTHDAIETHAFYQAVKRESV